jgi:DNA-binding IclR family transcriptional regulator
MNQTEPTPVKSAFRALQVLELLTSEGSPLSFPELQQKLGYPKASLHALLRTLAGARWIDLDPAARRYILGRRVWEAGVAYTKMLPLESLARPFMERVRDETTETVQLAVLDGFEVLYIAKVDGEHMLRLDSSVGLRLLPHATGVGKVLLADVSDERLTAWLAQRRLERYTPHTITEPVKLMKELQEVRRKGYATDREERTLGAACLAVAIHNQTGAVVAAMSVSAPAVRFGRNQRTAALQSLRVAAKELSAALGCSPVSPASRVHVTANRI